MKKEWVRPTPKEILDGLYQAGRSDAEIMFIFALLNKGVKEGRLRSQISCFDNVIGFFEMAERMYVKNEGMMLSDAELGIHSGQCESPLCHRLKHAYFEILRPSQQSDSEQIKKQLQQLAESILLGNPRPDLDGQESGFYDSQTGADLFEVKVVDITDKCIEDEEFASSMKNATDGGKREVLLCYIPYSGGMMCDIKDGYGGLFTNQAFNISGELSPDMQKAFELRASLVGIDTELFQAIIAANAPKTGSLKDSK